MIEHLDTLPSVHPNGGRMRRRYPDQRCGKKRAREETQFPNRAINGGGLFSFTRVLTINAEQ